MEKINSALLKLSIFYFKNKIAAKEAMYCCKCKLFIELSGGCYGIECPDCRSQLCVITQGYRWGPQVGERCHHECCVMVNNSGLW